MARRKNLKGRSGEPTTTLSRATGAKKAPVARPSPSEGDSQKGFPDDAEVLKSYLCTLTQALDVLVLLRSVEGRPAVGAGLDFYEEVRRFEADLIKAALRLSGGNQRRAAALLRLKTSTLHLMINRYKIDVAKS